MAGERHEYETIVAWTQDVQGTLAASGRPTVAVGAPPEFGGTADVWSPEHLCVAAVNACVMLTFIAIARHSKVAFTSYTAAATGTLERLDARGPVITRVVVKPRITIAPDADRSKVERVVKMAEKHCYISNSLNGEVRIEADIIVA